VQARDSFSRVAGASSSGWGSADVGGTWQHRFNGAGGDASASAAADGTRGRVVVTTTSTSGAKLVLSSVGPSVADADLQVTGRADRSGTTSGAFLALAGRATGGDSYYAATINLVGNTFSIRYWTGFWQTISSVTGPSPAFTANTDYSIRFQLQGNSLRAKWWVAGQPEPAAWTIQTTNTDQTRPSAGQSGVVAAVGAASTTVNFAFDDFLAVPLVGGASGQSGVPAAPTDSPTTVRRDRGAVRRLSPNGRGAGAGRRGRGRDVAGR
jgi:hypothetical protein